MPHVPHITGTNQTPLDMHTLCNLETLCIVVREFCKAKETSIVHQAMVVCCRSLHMGLYWWLHKIDKRVAEGWSASDLNLRVV